MLTTTACPLHPHLSRILVDFSLDSSPALHNFLNSNSHLNPRENSGKHFHFTSKFSNTDTQTDRERETHTQTSVDACPASLAQHTGLAFVRQSRCSGVTHVTQSLQMLFSVNILPGGKSGVGEVGGGEWEVQEGMGSGEGRECGE